MTLQIVIVSLGAVLFLIALEQFYRAYRLSEAIQKNGRWFVLGFMVLGFLVGYLIFINHLLAQSSPTPTDQLVSIIFFGGSIFVLTCSYLFLSTTSDLMGTLDRNEHQRKQLMDQAEVLGQTVDRKTYELSLEKARLADEASRAQVLEKERMEMKLVANQRLEGIGLMASGIAHDFNNLLVGILGNASYAKQLGPDEASDFAEALEDVVEAAERAADLTQQLTAYCGKGPSALERVDFGATTQEMLGLMRSSLAVNVKIVSELTDDLARVWGDAARFRQLIMNLVTNGVEATPSEGGNLIIRTGLKELSDSELSEYRSSSNIEAGSYVYFEVQDEGPGVSESDQSRVFDPFFSTKGIGRGLGLAAAEGIASSHGGAIILSSTPGQGARVRAIFPVILEESDSVDSGDPGERSPRRLGKILVVDDELIVLDTIRRGLRRAGYEVETASDRAGFRQLIESAEKEFSAAIIDVMIPDIAFDDMFESLRSRFPEMPIIISSGYSDLDHWDKFSNEKLVSFLTKPYRVESLLAEISRFGAIPDQGAGVAG